MPLRLPLRPAAVILCACALAPPAPANGGDAATPSGEKPSETQPANERGLEESGDGPYGFNVRGDEWTLVSSARGLSLHKPIFVFPATYSPEYSGSETEFVFQFSAKHRLLGTELYFGYTQRSFWQLYNEDESRPFRETNFNPELFYRWEPQWKRLPELGLDIGLEHESNGRDLPLSRSWNRIYGGLFLPRGKSLYYLKGWWRIPERAKRDPEDAGGDDNPDIQDYLGYGELHYARQIGEQQQLALMLRGNPATGKGAVSVTWSRPNSNRTFFYAVRLWHGYGESLIDYDRSVTRFSLGIMLAR